MIKENAEISFCINRNKWYDQKYIKIVEITRRNWRLMDLINLRIQIVGNCEKYLVLVRDSMRSEMD